MTSFQRKREPEWMDDPGLSPDLHRHALAGLRRINWWSRSGVAVWRAIERHVKSHFLSEVRILDLACGSGDVSLRVAALAKSRGLQAHVTGVDCSPVAIDEARRHVAGKDIPNAEFMVLDLFCDEIPGHYDIAMCSLFLHHLEAPQAVALLRRMKDSARRLVLVDDLRRSRTGYYLAWMGSRLLSRSPVVHRDALLSVAGAFTPQEAVGLAAEAGLENASCNNHWPQRFLMQWSPFNDSASTSQG